MFLQLPFHSTTYVQHIVLILNTVIVITSLIVVELVYADAPPEKRRQLRYFYPLVLVLAAMLAYAVYNQVKHP